METFKSKPQATGRTFGKTSGIHSCRERALSLRAGITECVSRPQRGQSLTGIQEVTRGSLFLDARSVLS